MTSGENPPRRGIPRPLSGGPVKFGPYWLDARLAVGGTAEVYVARPIDPQGQPRRLIVKRLLPHFVNDPDGLTMFEREAALHTAVHSDNVVEVYASGMCEGEPWLAMELVEGCDLYRLLRRLAGDNTKLGVGVAVRVAREVLRALESVHGARDPTGVALGIVHRDVTPSNVYLSTQGAVKLGDFGIARSSSRATMRSGGAAMLKGKFAYLSPEQVAGEPFDHRADLFSLAVMLSEMLIGRPLFAGSGQLAVLLAIRDCRIDGLREIRGILPAGLYAIVERALSRDPAARFSSASALSEALAPFDGNPQAAVSELSALVRWVQSKPSTETMDAVRESAGKIRAAVARRDAEADAELPESERITGEYEPLPSHVVTQGGAKLGPWPFARLVEAIATGEVRRGDMVDYMGRGMAAIEAVPELERFLPALTATTHRMGVVGVPDFVDEVTPASLVSVLLRVIATGATGVLFAEGPTESRRQSRTGRADLTEGGRKDLYFVAGRLHHVSSNNASELLGEFLVRRQVISRDELDFALAVLPAWATRSSRSDSSRRSRSSARSATRGATGWSICSRGPRAASATTSTRPRPTSSSRSTSTPCPCSSRVSRRARRAKRRCPSGGRGSTAASAGSAGKLRDAAWPAVARRVLELVDRPRKIREVLAAAAPAATSTASDVLRALEVLSAAALVTVA